MTKARILAIDDDDAVLGYLRRTLGSSYSLLTSADPRAAVKLAQIEQPDLILCDIDMPGMDGGAVCAALAEDPRTASIPFVYLTGIVSPAEVNDLSGEVGGKPGVAKRANLNELMAVIQAQLQRKAIGGGPWIA